MLNTESILGVDLESDQFRLFLLDNMVWPIVIVAFIIFSILIPRIFASVENLQFLLYSSSTLGLIVLAESLCLISGHFDLSVGSITGFSAVFTAMLLANWFPNTGGIVGILIILGVGALIGLGNGVAVSIFGVNPFLQTLGFFIVFRSAITVLTTRSVSDLPEIYLALGSARIHNVPIAIIFVIALYILTWAWLNYSRTGLALYAIGGDKESAQEAGINTQRLVLGVYVLSGILCALAGLIITGFLGAATTTLAQNSVFPAFAATVIGGISLLGGRGNVLNAFGGVLLLTTIEGGLVMLRIQASIVNTVNGIVLILAIFLFTFGERYRRRILSS